jgi:hypothetical protein
MDQLTSDVVIHVDSDVVLMRPFQISSVIDGDGRVRLYARPDGVDETLPSHIGWHRTAEKLLGIEEAGVPITDFITSFVPWKRQNAVALLEHVQMITGRHWFRALAAAWDVSEYTLYGRFVTDVLSESAGQFLTSSSLCRDYWSHTALSPRELEAFLNGTSSGEVAVSITAKAGMRPADYTEALERRWTALPE